MKKLTYLVLAGATLFSCAKQDNNTETGKYNLKMNFADAASGKAVLHNGESKDTVAIVNHLANFTGHIASPAMVSVEVIADSLDRPFGTSLFLENSDIKATITEKGSEKEITGSTAQDELKSIEDNFPGKAQMDAWMEEYRAAAKAGDEAKIKTLLPTYDSLDDAKKAYYASQVAQYNKSHAMAYLITRMTYSTPVDEIEAMTKKFAPEMADTKYVKRLMEHVEKEKALAIGKEAPDFTLAGLNQTDSVSLSDFRGKYVLVDFWATWCGPCMRELPEIKEIYAQYAGANFEIFGVSLDNDGDKWRSIVESKEMTWAHASDLKGWGSAAGKIYNVRAIPNNVLVGPDGTIVAKNLHGEELGNKLEEVLGAVSKK
ncbi:TlpA disulfide reductase family protein [Algivirga pacifica]|uniref:TlpA disulfide reductase family protein n=1 Tax=Algivirga pacifica TaxID=1162670 RepID=A0ABP9DCD6_9BACT